MRVPCSGPSSSRHGSLCPALFLMVHEVSLGQEHPHLRQWLHHLHTFPPRAESQGSSQVWGAHSWPSGIGGRESSRSSLGPALAGVSLFSRCTWASSWGEVRRREGVKEPRLADGAQGAKVKAAPLNSGLRHESEQQSALQFSA